MDFWGPCVKIEAGGLKVKTSQKDCIWSWVLKDKEQELKRRMRMLSQTHRLSCPEYLEPPKFSNFESLIISTKIIFQIGSLLKKAKIRLRSDFTVGLATHSIWLPNNTLGNKGKNIN